jgi:NADPH2:quinone reductase
VIAAASSDEKLELCKKLGADELINYSETNLKDAVKELTGGRGVDVVYDPVGGEYSEPAVRSMAWNGRYLVIGFASGPIPEIPLNLARRILGPLYRRGAGAQPAEHPRADRAV